MELSKWNKYAEERKYYSLKLESCFFQNIFMNSFAEKYRDEYKNDYITNQRWANMKRNENRITDKITSRCNVQNLIFRVIQKECEGGEILGFQTSRFLIWTIDTTPCIRIFSMEHLQVFKQFFNWKPKWKVFHLQFCS